VTNVVDFPYIEPHRAKQMQLALDGVPLSIGFAAGLAQGVVCVLLLPAGCAAPARGATSPVAPRRRPGHRVGAEREPRLVTAFERLLTTLDAHGSRITGNGRQRMAQCPAHDDRNPSLHITQGADRVLVKCQGSCDTDDVLAVLELTRADLFDEPKQNGNGRREVAAYDYTDEAGKLLFQVVRFEPKDFRQRRPEGAGWTWSLGNTRRVLYRLPAVLKAAESGETVYVVEGEKDVHAVEHVGSVATCNPGGAAKWRDDYTTSLTGAAVVVVADCDPTGRDHGRRVLKSLQSAGVAARLVEALVGKDVSDHLAADHTLYQLVSADGEDDDTSSRFEVEYLDRHQLDDLPTPAQLIDGVLTRHAYAMLTGRDSTYKSFIALDWSLCLATGRRWQNHDTERCRVLYIAGEGAYGLPQRVDAWEHDKGVTVEPGWFTVRRSAVNLYRPDNGALSELLARIDTNQYGLVVIDTLRRASGGADGNGTDMGVVVDNIERIKRATGDGTALAVAHTDKGDNDARGYSGIEDDADIVWHAKVADGHLTLKNTKQKDQAEHDEMQLCANPVLDSLVIVADRFSFDAPNTSSETKILLALLEPFAAEPATKSELMEVTGLAKSTFYLARGRLLDSGQIKKVGIRYVIGESNGVHSGDIGQSNESNGVQPGVSAPDLGLSNESNGVQSNAKSPVQSSSPLGLDDGQTLDGTLPEDRDGESDTLELLDRQLGAKPIEATT
jgi:hypothetical protein